MSPGRTFIGMPEQLAGVPQARIGRGLGPQVRVLEVLG